MSKINVNMSNLRTFEMGTALGHTIEATFIQLDEVICNRKMKNFFNAL